MTDLRKAAEDLLEGVEGAIKAGVWKVDGACDPDSVIVRLRQALAQTEQEFVGACVTCGAPKSEWLVDAVNTSQERVDETAKGEHEPVAWMTHIKGLNPLFHKTRASALNWQTKPTPLYTAPPKKEWVGLTDEEVEELDEKYGDDMLAHLDAVIAKLREKNT